MPRDTLPRLRHLSAVVVPVVHTPHGLSLQVIQAELRDVRRNAELRQHGAKRLPGVVGLLSALEESGYRMFHLLPSAAYLVPFDAQAPTDPLALNVFAAKPDRVDALARRGLLADPVYVT